MARWRPVDTRLWNDRDFKSLSDDGRLLWLFFLTCPSNMVPGVIVGGPAGLSESIGWTSKRFHERFEELSAKGLQIRADFDSRVVWLVNALRYAGPENPNQLKGWSKTWDEVPECELKHDIWCALRDSCAKWSETFHEGFPEPLREPSAKPPRNQDQDQDQDQEKDQEQFRDAVAGKPRVSRRSKLPDDWKPNAGHVDRAIDLEVDIRVEAEKFVNYHTAKGTTFAKPDAAFTNWLINASGWKRDSVGGRGNSAANLLDWQMQRIREAKDRERNGE